ncbi:MAG: hypothetical protein WBR13_11910 [Allosphingosinicella sp.]
MNSYECPEWLKRRRITESEYGRWLDSQATSIWRRERQCGNPSFAARADLKLALHRAAHDSNGRDPYSASRFFVRHMRAGWTDKQSHLKGNRHFLTLRRCMPSFDHVRGLGRAKYELCTRETNSAKSFMSPAQFIDLCNRVARHLSPTPGVGQAARADKS